MYSIYFYYIRDHSSITSAKRWVGVAKCWYLLTSWVGGVAKCWREQKIRKKIQGKKPFFACAVKKVNWTFFGIFSAVFFPENLTLGYILLFLRSMYFFSIKKLCLILALSIKEETKIYTGGWVGLRKCWMLTSCWKWVWRNTDFDDKMGLKQVKTCWRNNWMVPKSSH